METLNSSRNGNPWTTAKKWPTKSCTLRKTTMTSHNNIMTSHDDIMTSHNNATPYTDRYPHLAGLDQFTDYCLHMHICLIVSPIQLNNI